MFKAFEFCIPTTEIKVPAGPEWLHEIKHDGFRQRVDRDRVRLIARGGYDWTKRYPWIVEAASKNRQKQFIVDGEAVILGVDGISDCQMRRPYLSSEDREECWPEQNESLRDGSRKPHCIVFHGPAEVLLDSK
jgi:hypothetical protein